MAMRDVFSRIPMSTWRWLGVNDLSMPAGLADRKDEIKLSVAAGERSKHIVELRENGAQEIYVDVAEGAELSLVYIQFAPTDAPVASCIHANVARGDCFPVR